MSKSWVGEVEYTRGCPVFKRIVGHRAVGQKFTYEWNGMGLIYLVIPKEGLTVPGILGG